MGGIVGLLEPERLPVEGALHVLQFALQAGELRLVLPPCVGDRAGELLTKQPEPIRAEDPTAEKSMRGSSTFCSLMPSTRG